MPEEAAAILDQFLRDCTRLNVGIFGLAYVLGDNPAMSVLRNRQGDPVEQAKMVLNIIQSAVQDGRVETQEVKPLN